MNADEKKKKLIQHRQKIKGKEDEKKGIKQAKEKREKKRKEKGERVREFSTLMNANGMQNIHTHKHTLPHTYGPKK